jgi:uncharacterized iron-regulated membrane protein
MSQVRRSVRKILLWSHRWLGLAGGLFILLLAFSGGIVTFRPQIANLLSPQPAAVASCVPQVDWNQAEREIEAYGHARINRVYAPTAPDARWRFRMVTGKDAIYDHVIYDACAGRILGTANLAWMDWMVDFHHNLRFDQPGRTAGGWAGILLLLTSLGGLLLWLVSNPNIARLFRIRSGILMQRDLHTTTGVLLGALLLAGSFTSLWLCFPQTMRAGLAMFIELPADARAPRSARPPKGAARAGLGAIIQTAQRTIPDGSIREIRLPREYGNVQVRMWRKGDFRSLGNNVVTVDNVVAKVIATNLYETRGSGDRIVQAMAGIHYGEWGGLLFRSLYGIAGLVSALMLLTGFLIWWLPKRLAASAVKKATVPERETVSSLS